MFYGDGEQTRDFTFVENAVQANLLACEAPNASGEVFNIGTGARISLNQTLACFGRISGKNCKPSMSPHVTETSETPRRISPKRVNDLGYEPTVMFEEGLERTFDWYRLHHTKKAEK